ncbi:unnamed protein product, partial [Mesorhabditis belari]|uniref:Uncharacterized protein n=1 Tax=Mesorhabditis belari TaxID=2138241 RepID=A0AAF3F0H9_9BILA
MGLSQNLRILAISILVLFVIGIILALRGTTKQEVLEVDKKALESTFIKKEAEPQSQIHENIGDNVEVDPINFQIEQPDDTNGDSSQDELNQIINTLIEKEAKLTLDQEEALRTTGNDMKGFEEQMTTPDILEIDPFAIEATTTTIDSKLSLQEGQSPELVQTEPIKILTPNEDFKWNGDPRIDQESRIVEETNSRRGDTFVYNVSNVLNLAPNQGSPIENGNPVAVTDPTTQQVLPINSESVTDPITTLLALTQNNATVIPETNTTVYENGTVIGQLVTPTPALIQPIGFLELHTELPSTPETAAANPDSIVLAERQPDAQAVVQKLDETDSIEGPQSFFRPPPDTILEVPVLTSVRVVNGTQSDIKTLFDVGISQANDPISSSTDQSTQSNISI